MFLRPRAAARFDRLLLKIVTQGRLIGPLCRWAIWSCPPAAAELQAASPSVRPADGPLGGESEFPSRTIHPVMPWDTSFERP